MLKKSYKTVSKYVETEFIERRSRFIATVMPIQNEQQAIELINTCRIKYHDATHNVYAYVVGDNNICRYSDDGEPSGTAGIPVLDVLRKEELIDVAVVVTRYFGGIMLGGGGLVRAYGTACKKGVDDSGIIVRVLCDEIKITTDYVMLGKIQYHINESGHKLGDIEYNEQVIMNVFCGVDYTDKVLKGLVDITNARIIYEIVGQKYVDNYYSGT